MTNFNNCVCVCRIARKFHIRLLETRPPPVNAVAAIPCEKQLIWCCLLDSRQYTQHLQLQPALVIYYWERLL